LVYEFDYSLNQDSVPIGGPLGAALPQATLELFSFANRLLSSNPGAPPDTGANAGYGSALFYVMKARGPSNGLSYCRYATAFEFNFQSNLWIATGAPTCEPNLTGDYEILPPASSEFTPSRHDTGFTRQVLFPGFQLIGFQQPFRPPCCDV